MTIQHEVRVVCTHCLIAQTLEESTPWRGALTYGTLTVGRLKNSNPVYQLFLEGCRSQAVDPALQTPSGLAQAAITAPANYIARISVAWTQISSLAYKKTSKHTKDALAAEALTTCFQYLRILLPRRKASRPTSIVVSAADKRREKGDGSSATNCRTS